MLVSPFRERFYFTEIFCRMKERFSPLFHSELSLYCLKALL